jgi:hypothetical protein
MPTPTWCVRLGLLLFAGHALAQEPPHQHGVVRLDIAVEKQGFSIEMESPLDSLVGFEHATRGEAQEQAVRTMAAKLKPGDAVFKPNAEALCSASTSRLSSAVLAPALLGEAGEVQRAAKPDKHADLDGSFEMTCRQPEALRSISLARLFAEFPRLQRVQVQLVTANGQVKRTLTRSNAVVTW